MFNIGDVVDIDSLDDLLSEENFNFLIERLSVTVNLPKLVPSKSRDFLG